MWWNDGNGNFAQSDQIPSSSYLIDAAIGDINGDHLLDVMLTGTNDRGGEVWLNRGGGVFAQVQRFGVFDASSVDLGDLDGDGDLDAIIAPSEADVAAVWLNDGRGRFQDAQRLGRLGPTRLGDVDGDGDLDAITANKGVDKVWLNQGNAVFAFSGQAFSRDQSTNVALGDLDGDGDLDVAVSRYEAPPALWFNTPISTTLP